MKGFPGHRRRGFDTFTGYFGKGIWYRTHTSDDFPEGLATIYGDEYRMLDLVRGTAARGVEGSWDACLDDAALAGRHSTPALTDLAVAAIAAATAPAYVRRSHKICL